MDRLIRSQIEFYDARAPDYAVPWRPPDRAGTGLVPAELVAALVDEFAPRGDVLELACGPASFTVDLARHASTLTAVDASPRMLERARAATAGAPVEYVEADVMSWEPPRQYDAIFFGFWLSHVPEPGFDDFWRRLSTWLRPGGRVGFVDEDSRGHHHDEVRDVDGTSVARRTLADGSEWDIVKLFWDVAALEQRLTTLGWNIAVRPVADTLLYGAGTYLG
jgi:demethylmenaquinone methyltransferase/2-methoxy-6-polyprenyl-1,4-benzoquinol methylase